MALLAILAPTLSALAQDAPVRPDSQFLAALPLHGENAKHHADENGNSGHLEKGRRVLRARLRTSNGRLLIARDGQTTGFAWLAPDSAASSDSVWFEIVVPRATAQPVLIRDWKGRCLGHSDLLGSEYLVFGPCDRRQLYAYPRVSERGFWLVSTIGYVGPTSVSPMLVPQSTSDLWFTIEPEKTGAHADPR